MLKKYAQKISYLLKKERTFVLIGMLGIILIDIVLVEQFNTTIMLLILSIWVLLSAFYKLGEKNIAIFVVIFFILIVAFQISGSKVMAEKSAIWAYLTLMMYLYTFAGKYIRKD